MKPSEKKFLLILVLASFFLRVLIIHTSKLTFFSDDAIYAEIARFWIQKRFDLVFHPTWPPLYSAISAFFFLFLRNWETSLRMVSAVSGSFVVIPLFYMANLFLTRKTALFFSVVTPLIYPLFKISIFPMSDMLATTLILSSLALILYTINTESPRTLSLSGATVGLLYLTRSEGLMFFGLTLIFLSVWVFIKKISIYHLASYILVFFVVISPYLIAMKEKTGSWSLSQKFSAQIKQGHSFQINERGTTWSQEVVSVKVPNYKSDYFKGGAVQVLDYSNWYLFWFREKLLKWKSLFLTIFSPWILLIALSGAIISLARKKGWESSFIIYLSSFAFFATVFVVPVQDIRYLAWLLPIIILFFLQTIEYALLRSRIKNFAYLCSFLILLFPSFNKDVILRPQVVARQFSKDNFREEINKAGALIQENSRDPNPKIMMRHEGVEFYADGTTIYIPQDLTYEQFIDYAKVNNIDYVVAWSEELQGDKHLSILLTKESPRTELKDVFTNSVGGRTLIVYESMWKN